MFLHLILIEPSAMRKDDFDFFIVNSFITLASICFLISTIKLKEVWERGLQISGGGSLILDADNYKWVCHL